MTKEDYIANLESLVKQIIKPLKKIPLNLIVESVFKTKILPFDLTKIENQTLLSDLERVAQIAGNEVNVSGGIKSKRPNEAGNYIEIYVKNALCSVGYQPSTKTTKSGKNRAAGYPDFQFQDKTGRWCFLECKTFNIKNIDTTQRSFFLSPSTDSKVNFDGLHLAISFELAVKNDKFLCQSYKILSLENLTCDLKQEFNSDNKRLYSQDVVVAEGKFS